MHLRKGFFSCKSHLNRSLLILKASKRGWFVDDSQMIHIKKKIDGKRVYGMIHLDDFVKKDDIGMWTSAQQIGFSVGVPAGVGALLLRGLPTRLDTLHRNLKTTDILLFQLIYNRDISFYSETNRIIASLQWMQSEYIGAFVPSILTLPVLDKL